MKLQHLILNRYYARYYQKDIILPREMRVNNRIVSDYAPRPGFKASGMAPHRTMAATSSMCCIKGSDLL